MKVAVLIGVSEYENPINNLPACKNDIKLIKELIIATNKYNKILCISEATCASQIRDELSKIHEFQYDGIEELLFYYTGHGHFDGDEFYYTCFDSNIENIGQTFLSNSEIDNLIRDLKPNITVKVVDACNAGVMYIKSVDYKSKPLKEYLEESKGKFKNCYFMFSSQVDQNSIADEKISFFTRSFLKAIKNHKLTKIKYREIMGYIADEFKLSNQTPIFVSQGNYTHTFCNINLEIRNLIALEGDSSYFSDETKDQKEDQKTEQYENSQGEIMQLIQKIQDKNVLLSICIAEALKIAQIYHNNDLIRFCKKELIGWKGDIGPNERIDKDDMFNYRMVEVFLTLNPINPEYFGWNGNVSNMFSYMEQNPKECFKIKLFQPEPISLLEQNNDYDMEKHFKHWTNNAKSMGMDLKNPNQEIHFYSRISVYRDLIETIRTELTKRLLDLLD